MTANPRHADPFVAYARLAGAAVLTAALLAGIAFFPVRVQFGEPAAVALLAGIAISLIGSWAGNISTVLTMNRAPAIFASGVLGGFGVRFVVTLGVALLVSSMGAFDRDALLISVGATQLAILAVDVYMVVRLSQRVMGAAE